MHGQEYDQAETEASASALESKPIFVLVGSWWYAIGGIHARALRHTMAGLASGGVSNHRAQVRGGTGPKDTERKFYRLFKGHTAGGGDRAFRGVGRCHTRFAL